MSGCVVLKGHKLLIKKMNFTFKDKVKADLLGKVCTLAPVKFNTS